MLVGGFQQSGGPFLRVPVIRVIAYCDPIFMETPIGIESCYYHDEDWFETCAYMCVLPTPATPC